MLKELEDAMVLVATLPEEDQRRVARNIRIVLRNIEDRDTMTDKQRRTLRERDQEARNRRVELWLRRFGE